MNRLISIAYHRCLLVLAVLVWADTAFAQWTSQTISLRPGWNAIFLEIQPEPRDCDTLFTNLPVESVWMWNRRFNPVQYVQDPDQLIIGQPDWLTYVPTNNPGRPAMNLFSLLGGRPYLVKLAGSVNRSWVIQGRPAIRRIEWLSDAQNFVGFPLDPNSAAPTFQSFFAGSPAHAGQAIYRLDAFGSWILTPATATLNRGEAFWIRTVGQSTFSGPLSVEFEQGNGVDYGRILTEQTLRIRNSSTASKTIRARRLSSAIPPSGTNYPALAGDVPLYYFVMNLATTNVGWAPLPDPLSKLVATNREWAIRLEVRRSGMTNPPAGAINARYQSVLEITDGAGSRLLVPITPKGLQASTDAAGIPAPVRGFGPASHDGDDPHPRSGLWVGSAAITHVSQPASFTPSNPFPTATEFQFRLLVQVDASGQARLLQQVIPMWKNGSYTTNAQGIKEVDQPGRYVLLTDERYALIIPDVTGAALRDGQPVGRRFSSAALASPLPCQCQRPGNLVRTTAASRALCPWITMTNSILSNTSIIPTITI